MRFLAVLELFKQGVVDLEQVESFGDWSCARSRPASGSRSTSSSLDEWGDEPTAIEPRSTSTRIDGLRVDDAV